MKGQFFLITAIMLCVIFYVVAKPLVFNAARSEAHDEGILENLRSEILRAGDMGVKEKRYPEALFDFLAFLKTMLSRKGVIFNSLAVSTKNESDRVNVTVFNIYGKPMRVNISVGDESNETLIDNNETKSFIFNPPERFNMSVKTSDFSTIKEMVKHKFNLYVYLKIIRGDDIIRTEVYG